MAVSNIFCLAFTAKPDSYWSWIVCGCAALTQAMTMGVLFSFGILFPVFMDYFQETREKTAWVGSLGVALVFFFGPLSGSLINRFGCRITTIAGGLTCVSSLVIASFANSLTILFIAYSVLYGLGSSFVFASSWIIVSKYFLNRRSLALGLVGGGQGLGVMAQGPLLQFLLDTTDWRGTFRVMAGIVFSTCLVAFSYAPVEDTDCEPANTVLEDGSSEVEKTKSNNVQGKFTLDFSVCKVPVVVAVAMSAGLQHFGRLTPQIHLVKYCATLDISADSASTLYIFIGMASIISRISSGFICDLPCVNSLYVYQVAVFFQGLSTLLSVFAKTYVPLAVYAFIFGLCDGAFITTLNICLLKSVDSSRRASVIALHHPVISVFLASGAPISGLIADRTGSYVPAFLMAGGVIVVASTIPFVLLSPCLRRDTVRVRDQAAAREELEIGKQSAVHPYADNAGFFADEAMDGDEDALQKNETPVVTVEVQASDTSNNKSAGTPDNKRETQVDVHNEITENQRVTKNFTDNSDRDCDEETDSGNAQDLKISYKEENMNFESNPQAVINHDQPRQREERNFEEGSTLRTACAVNEGFTDDDAEDGKADLSGNEEFCCLNSIVSVDTSNNAVAAALKDESPEKGESGLGETEQHSDCSGTSALDEDGMPASTSGNDTFNLHLPSRNEEIKDVISDSEFKSCDVSDTKL